MTYQIGNYYNPTTSLAIITIAISNEKTGVQGPKFTVLR